jgi:hypothetical protein
MCCEEAFRHTSRTGGENAKGGVVLLTDFVPTRYADIGH